MVDCKLGSRQPEFGPGVILKASLFSPRGKFELALLEGCKHSLEITIPVEAVAEETLKVTGNYQKLAKLPGFRPGKAPTSLIRKHFEGDIRQKVLETLVP